MDKPKFIINNNSNNNNNNSNNNNIAQKEVRLVGCCLVCLLIS